MIWAIAAGSILALLGLVVWLARREGAKSAQVGMAEESAERAKEANEIDEDVKRASADELDRRLRATRE